MDDRVQPRPQLAHLLAVLQRAPRLHEALLDGVLAAALGKHAPCVAMQLRAVALDDRLEGRLVPSLHQLEQPLIGLRSQQSYGHTRSHGATLTV